MKEIYKYILNMIPLIGLTGRKRAGKDTSADYLCAKYGYKKAAYADPLKTACQCLFGLREDQLYNQSLKEEPDPYWKLTPRYLMQFLGTDLLRKQFDPDIWIKLMEKKIGSGEGWIITDVRFRNEAEFIKSRGGIIIKIVRPSIDIADDHESEVQDISYDYLVNNDKGLEQLYSQLTNFLPNRETH